jgi:hypothetical protein
LTTIQLDILLEFLLQFGKDVSALMSDFLEFGFLPLVNLVGVCFDIKLVDNSRKTFDSVRELASPKSYP